jgi:hypothetical protein
MTINMIADEIFRELLSPTDNSVAAISFWLRANVGNLNTKIGGEYTLSSNGLNFSPDLGEDEKFILKQLYLIYYNDLRIRENLGAAALSAVLEVSSDGATVRTVNRNEISKSYLQLRKQLTEDLEVAIKNYNNSSIEFRQVAGDDVIQANGTEYVTERENRSI